MALGDGSANSRARSGDSEIAEYAEKIKHGHTLYKASWKGAGGYIDGLVTSAGDNRDCGNRPRGR